MGVAMCRAGRSERSRTSAGCSDDVIRRPPALARPLAQLSKVCCTRTRVSRMLGPHSEALPLDGTEIDRLATPSANIMGITIGPAGDLWYVDPVANEVVRVGP